MQSVRLRRREVIKLFSCFPPEQLKPEARVSINGKSDDCNKRSEDVESALRTTLMTLQF